MIYSLIPMIKQSDLGFGMVATSFLNASDVLSKDSTSFALGFEFLPICYLKRHCIELFLKSFIVLLHRYYKLPFDGASFDSPKPQYQEPNGQWKDLFKEHDLHKLFLYFQSLIIQNRNDIEEKTLVLCNV